jgi:hypothetical protein
LFCILTFAIIDETALFSIFPIFFSCLSDSANLFPKISLTRIEAPVVRQKMGQNDLQQFFATNTNSHSFSTLAP